MSQSTPKILIAVMGMTGSGKSTFIKTASQLDVDIGHDLKSCKRLSKEGKRNPED